MAAILLPVASEADLDAAISRIDARGLGNPTQFTIALTSPMLSLGSVLTPINLRPDDGLAIIWQENTIDGGGALRALFIAAGSVSISNLTISHAVAVGGAGGSGLVGGGGGGLGGAVFVREGASLTIGAGGFTGNSEVAGAGSGNGGDGAAAGADLFVMTSSVVVLDPGADATLSFAGGIADDSAASLPSGGGFTAGTAAGAGLVVVSGTVSFGGSSSFAGGITLATGATVLADRRGVRRRAGRLRGAGHARRRAGS